VIDLAGRATSVVLRAAAALGIGLAVFAIILAGIGFFAAGAFIHLAHLLGPAKGAAVMGGALFVLAILVGLAGAWSLKNFKKRRPSMLSEFNATFGLGARLLVLLVRRDPKKAILLAAVTGAIVEYLLGDDKK
jgi:hypothetical protein